MSSRSTPTLVKGSHGRVTDNLADGPLFISSEPRLMPDGPIAATAVKDIDACAMSSNDGALVRRQL